MKHIDEYRDPQKAQRLIADIRSVLTRRWVLMEVCGGQTHSLLRHGIAQELRDDLELIHGPGCPVCVTPAAAIDLAQSIAEQSGTTLVSFGDMLRVPGSTRSLADARRSGASTKVVYSPLDAVQLAQRYPAEQFVFFAVGFETTAPATALAVLQAQELKLENFSLLAAHVRVQPAMKAILKSPDNRVQGFLAAGHVCAITGYNSYRDLANQFLTPIVVTGFEPLDLLKGILGCVTQLEAGQHCVENHYARAVSGTGNLDAQSIVSQVFEISNQPWRGLGTVPAGGLTIRPKWERFDASVRFREIIRQQAEADDHNCECRAAEVLTGRIRPSECAAFGRSCRPEAPLGAPMVSTEGACAAYYRFARNPTGQGVELTDA